MTTFELTISGNHDHRLEVKATVKWADLGVMGSRYDWDVEIVEVHLISSNRKRKIALPADLEAQAIEQIIEQINNDIGYELYQRQLEMTTNNKENYV